MTQPSVEPIQPAVDFAILADAAQAAGGKLYVLGGGWDTLFVSAVPARHPSLGVGIRFRVPWSWTDRPITVELGLQNEDGHDLLPSGALSHTLTVTRPDGALEGTDIGVVRAFTFNNLVFPELGGYSFVISIDGDVVERVRFGVRRGAS